MLILRALCVSLFLFSSYSFATELRQIDETKTGRLFTIEGSNTVGARLAPLWAKRYLEAKGLSSVTITPRQKENEYKIIGLNRGVPTFINIAAHGSSTGFKGLLGSTADIAMSSRPIKDKEDKALNETDMLDVQAEHVVAIDGLAIIVHPMNPITHLSKSQVAQIFSGEISSWKEISGFDQPINLYARDNNSGTWDTFKNVVLAKKYQLDNKAKRFESNDQLSSEVSRDVAAIGFVGLASVLDAKALAISDEGTEAMLPESIFVATEDYPLARRLFMYTQPHKLNTYGQEFLNFVQTATGQGIVEEVGFISQKPVSIALESRNGPQSYIDLVKTGERLSVNFRFRQGSADLDNKAKRDIRRVVDYMKDEENQNKIIQLIGFGDAKKRDERSILLSKLRAISVKTELYRYGISTESVTGFGAFLPVAPNDGKTKFRNQRVEVWVYNRDEKPLIEQVKKDASLRKRQESTTNLVMAE